MATSPENTSTPRWLRVPDEHGWWYFVNRPENWDLGDMVKVWSIDPSGQDPYFEARFGEKGFSQWYQDGETDPYGKTTFYKGNVRIDETLGWWYGPLKIKRPEGQHGHKEI
jgi:hypothetical protein